MRHQTDVEGVKCLPPIVIQDPPVVNIACIAPSSDTLSVKSFLVDVEAVKHINKTDFVRLKLFSRSILYVSTPFSEIDVCVTVSLKSITKLKNRFRTCGL